jgi:hypothetical protein
MLSLIFKIAGFFFDWFKLARKGAAYAKKQKSRDALYRDPNGWFDNHFAGGVHHEPADETNETDDRYSAP